MNYNGDHNNATIEFLSFHFFNFVMFFKIIHKTIFNHVLAIDYIWRYKFVKEILYFGYIFRTHL
jgi:hypothetical protein